MRHARLERELKQKIFELLETNFHEVIRFEGEDVVYYKQLKISRRRLSKTSQVFHVKDTTHQDYPEIANVYLLNLIAKDIEYGNKSEKAEKAIRNYRSLES
jgi:hypothetical protein